MEIGPIFRALIHNKTRFWLISLEVALTLAITVNCVNMIMDQRAKMLRSSGIDEQNIIIASSEPYAPEFEEDDYVRAAFEEDLRALRALPGVRFVSSMHQRPLSQSGSSTGRRPHGSEIDALSAPFYVVSTDIVDALGVEMLSGRKFRPEDFPTPDEIEAMGEGTLPDRRNVIISKGLAEVLFPDGEALGQQIESGSGHAVNTVVGVIKHMHCSWPMSSQAERVMLYPGEPAGSRSTHYVVRMEPGTLDGLFTTVEEELLRVNEGRLVSLVALDELKHEQIYRELVAVNSLLGGVSILLVVVTSLGVVGLTAFSVTERRRQIGTRRALGATRLAILRYFLVENWLITGVGLALGLGLAYSLNFLLAQIADVPRLGFPLVLTGMLLLWLFGLLAALLPAVRSTSVPPVIATQTV